MRFSSTDGEIRDVPDMCEYCNMTTEGQHEPHCPIFKSLIAEGYRVNAKMNLKLAEEGLPLFLEELDEP